MLRLNTISAYDMLLSILSGTQQISELTFRQVIIPAHPGAFHQLFEEKQIGCLLLHGESQNHIPLSRNIRYHCSKNCYKRWSDSLEQLVAALLFMMRVSA